MTAGSKVPSGVQELISRLRDEGIKTGQDRAEQILQDAREKAEQILAEARTEADRLREQAHSAIQAEQAAAREAIRLAFRDTELKIKSEFKTAFAAHLRRLVSMELKDRDFLRQIILLVFGRVARDLSQDQPTELLLPSDLFADSGQETTLTDAGKKQLDHLLLGISGEMLREGVQLKPSDDIDSGIRIKLTGADLEIDLSDNALSNLLLKYLIPRYRAIVEGID